MLLFLPFFFRSPFGLFAQRPIALIVHNRHRPALDEPVETEQNHSDSTDIEETLVGVALAILMRARCISVLVIALIVGFLREALIDGRRR